jgi:hypothetical protein
MTSRARNALREDWVLFRELAERPPDDFELPLDGGVHEFVSLIGPNLQPIDKSLNCARGPIDIPEIGARITPHRRARVND